MIKVTICLNYQSDCLNENSIDNRGEIHVLRVNNESDALGFRFASSVSATVILTSCKLNCVHSTHFIDTLKNHATSVIRLLCRPTERIHSASYSFLSNYSSICGIGGAEGTCHASSLLNSYGFQTVYNPVSWWSVCLENKRKNLKLMFRNRPTTLAPCE